MSRDWRSKLGAKLATAGGAMRLLKPGMRLYLSAGSAVPQGLYPGLLDEQAPLGDNTILHLLTLGDAPYCAPQYASRFRHNALFIGSNTRAAVTAGRADYTPLFLSEIPQLIRDGRLPIDAALICVSPPDADGWCSLGTHVDLTPAVLDVRPVVIAEVNARMPRTHGPCRVHVDQLHAIVETDRALPEMAPRAVSGETEQIARHVAQLVPDGATLQLGIGAVPDALLKFLADRRDLGLHSEMFSDGVVELAERGIMTGAAKTLHPGRMVASFVLGSRRVYDFVHENAAVELHPADFTNDPFVIARNDNLVAINTCLEIDLTGQVCSDSLGASLYSGIGGQVDFIRGAARSRGGKPIIALPSTARGGVLSRITPRLADGAGVVTTRGDVHWVATEYGVVNLHGLTVRERALALISIAHPRFRPWLLAEAKRLGFAFADQLEPPGAATYPLELEATAQAVDGQRLLLRPIRPTDETLLRDLFYRLSQDSLRLRFLATRKLMPHENLQRFCTIDYDRDMTIVAVLRGEHAERIVGLAGYNCDADTGLAETAVLVDDAFQNRGIGTLLVRRLVEIAAQRGLRGFTAAVQSGNAPMRRVFAKCGRAVHVRTEGEVQTLRILFEDAPGGWSG